MSSKPHSQCRAARGRRAPGRQAVTLLALALITTAGCLPFFRSTRVPMPSEEIAPREGPCTAVLLPGFYDRLGSFEKEGFAEIAARRAPGLGLVATGAHFGYYRERTVLVRLEEDVFEPLRAGGAEEIWLVGVSMGGLGALLNAREQPEAFAGLLLLAPFLGEDEVLEEIRAAGGLGAWEPPETLDEKDFSRRVWKFLKRWQAAGGEEPPIYLGYGTDDDLAEADDMLAELLPPERVFRRPGGHDWKVWRDLWERFLASDALAACG